MPGSIPANPCMQSANEKFRTPTPRLLRCCERTIVPAVVPTAGSSRYCQRFEMASQALRHHLKTTEFGLASAMEGCSWEITFVAAALPEGLPRLPAEDDLMTENRRRALAESYFELGETGKAEVLYRDWLHADPRWDGAGSGGRMAKTGGVAKVTLRRTHSQESPQRVNNNRKRSNQANARHRWGRKVFRHGNPMCLARLKDRKQAACLPGIRSPPSLP
jgi:hypothetical protein